MKLSDAQRETILYRLSDAGGSLICKLDGQEVKFQVFWEGPLKYCIRPLVEGKFKVRWMHGDCEEFGIRLLKTTHPKLYSKRDADPWRKAGFKKEAREIEATRYTKRDFFRCPIQLARHIEREFSTFEVLD